MIGRDNIDGLASGSSSVIDAEGKRTGPLGQLYLDDWSEEPTWATVRTGLFGLSETFVPLAGATLDGEDIRLPYTTAQIKDAPRVEPDGQLAEGEEKRLYRHYGVAGTEAAGPASTGTGRTRLRRYTGSGG
ncbi:PRC-barrel domain containing protein [Arthrobacter mobilis]|uniref:PRC-barrel domain containing protein n=1 Tax=Arthrobacter mobilis TaxID=2724944 RepID=A0A7X6K5N5_9MICC|nr:PRC-barrel domain containing protein [Arthrobacter mobilis]NKX54035.1 PRC-barrel domain containing protein [Arthrobacter mobilis]